MKIHRLQSSRINNNNSFPGVMLKKMNENSARLPVIKMKQEPCIKKEPIEYNSKQLFRNNSRDILMDFGMGRKKVICLDDSNSLFTEFNQHISLDPAFSDLLLGAYPVFQEFNARFKTWVDVGCEKNLRDGAVVKVLFFPKAIESDCSNSGSVKRKKDGRYSKRNPKHLSIDKDYIENNSYSLNQCVVKNEQEYVEMTKRSNVKSTDTQNPLLNKGGSESHLINHAVAPFPVSVKTEHRMSMHDTSTNVQPQHFVEKKAAQLHPDFHRLSDVERTTEAVLSERQIFNVTPSRVQSCVGSQDANIPQSNSPVNLMIARIKPLLDEEKQAAKISQKSATEAVDSGRLICGNQQAQMRVMRLILGRLNIEKTWWNTVFSDIALFSLQGNYIKYFERSYFTTLSKTKCEIFWGFRSFNGPNIIAPLELSRSGAKFEEVLKNKVIRRVKDHYESSDVTLQFPSTLKTQLGSKVVRNVLAINSIILSEWPACVKGLSPMNHAWKLVGEKVKNILCSSKQEMISILTEVWEKDVDVQIMCSELISLLPETIESIVQNK